MLKMFIWSIRLCKQRILPVIFILLYKTLSCNNRRPGNLSNSAGPIEYIKKGHLKIDNIQKIIFNFIIANKFKGWFVDLF